MKKLITPKEFMVGNDLTILKYKWKEYVVICDIVESTKERVRFMMEQACSSLIVDESECENINIKK